MSRVLVTGATGFVGFHLSRALAREGHEVVALVRSTSDRSELAHCSFVMGNLLDRESIRVALKGVQAVFHLGGLMSSLRARSAEVERVNVDGTWNLVELCVELGIPRLIHVSSAAVIGASDSPLVVLNEASKPPMSLHRFLNYGAKLRSEEIVLKACAEGGLDAVIVNPSVIFGAGDAKKEARRGNLLAAQGLLRFFPEGGVSVAPVEDVVAGMLAAWRKGRKGERYILSGENITLRTLLGLYAELAGARAPERELPTWLLRSAAWLADRLGLGKSHFYEGAVSATLYHWFDHSKAARELDYHPRPAREAVAASVNWMREHRYVTENRPRTALAKI